MRARTIHSAARRTRRTSKVKTRDFKALCIEIIKEVRLTPPALIDRLCEGVPLPLVCRDAIFAEELIEVAKKLGRAHLVTFEKCDP